MTEVIKRDGNKESLDIEKLHKVVSFACENERSGFLPVRWLWIFIFCSCKVFLKKDTLSTSFWIISVEYK